MTIILVKGFKLGMLLQFAIGPVCIFILQTASLQGFLAAEAGVLGVAIVDALFIAAAILGLGSVMANKPIGSGLKLFGAAVLFIFGLNLVLSSFGVKLLPGLIAANFMGTNSSFVYAVVLTASNPLAVLFWAGVFSTKISEETVERKSIYIFGFGALLATVSFLTMAAFIGSLAQVFVTPIVTHVSNFIAGVAFVYFSAKSLRTNRQ